MLVLRGNAIAWLTAKSYWQGIAAGTTSNQGCARDLLSRDRDVASSEMLAETLKLARFSRVSGASTSRRDVFHDVWWNTSTM